MENVSTGGDALPEMQEAFATQSPVVVLGPGCHRVGYDEESAEAWQRVACRVSQVWLELASTDGDDAKSEAVRGFLRDFWISKLSDDRLAEDKDGDWFHSGLPTDLSLPGGWGRPDQSSSDAARAVIGAALLRALFECTRCLGHVIATGASPVTDWQTVAYPSRSGRESGEARAALSAAEEQIATVEEVSGALYELAGAKAKTDVSDSVLEILGDRGLGGLELTPSLKADLVILKLGAVTRAMCHLRKFSFDESPEFGVSGALVEWLADLFWHVMIRRSRVPPSQAEIAFFLNLQASFFSDGQPQPRAFSRSRPGELRGRVDGETLARDVRRMTEDYDSGLGPVREPDGKRAKFTSTVASSLLEMWRRRHHESSELPIIALASDYDLSFERAIIERLKPDEALHLVFPVWHTKPGQKTLEWVFATLVNPEERFEEHHVTVPVTAEWYRELPAVDWDLVDGTIVRGPILVKLNGSPKTKLSDEVKSSLKQVRKEIIEPAVIFTEFDSLQAISSFAAQGDEKRNLASGIVNRLTWHEHSWVFLGDSLPDWLPRVRLIFSARGVFSGRSADSAQHLAIDREFEWPEVALLDALKVVQLKGDLGELADYPDSETMGSPDHDVHDFLVNVKAIRDQLPGR